MHRKKSYITKHFIVFLLARDDYQMSSTGDMRKERLKWPAIKVPGWIHARDFAVSWLSRVRAWDHWALRTPPLCDILTRVNVIIHRQGILKVCNNKPCLRCFKDISRSVLFPGEACSFTFAPRVHLTFIHHTTLLICVTARIDFFFSILFSPAWLYTCHR